MHIKYRLSLVVFMLFTLNACHNKMSSKPYRAGLLVDLSQVNSYQFIGKMSFSDGQDGGSGQIKWQQQNNLINAQLKAPLGSKSWQIIESIQGAELIANGESMMADSAQSLISAQLGWQIPWQQLKSWVVGLPYDHQQAKIVWDEGGYMVTENGWQIEYTRMKKYPIDGSQALPHKMIAKKGSYSIKLIIKQWEW